MITTTITPVIQPTRAINSNRFLSTVALNPLDTLTADDTVAANNNDIVELSPQAQQLLDFYQQQYEDDLVLKKAELDKIIAKNQAQDIVDAQALQDQLAAFDASNQLLDTLNTQNQDSQPVDYYTNTLANAQPQADNDNVTYQLLLQLQNIRLVA